MGESSYFLRLFFSLIASKQIKAFKEALRLKLSAERKALRQEQVAVCSSDVVEQIASTKVFRAARHVMIYYPIQQEIDVRGLMAYGSDKHFYMPVTQGNSMEVREYVGETYMRKGQFGIPEPLPPEYGGKLDLIIVPGVAFDQHKYRLGRGGGYYDRFLRRQHGAYKIGVGYGFQLLEDMPVTWHDVRMDKVITSTADAAL